MDAWSKLSKICSCFLLPFHKFICLITTKCYCNGNCAFQNQRARNVNYVQRLWTGTVQCALVIKCRIMKHKTRRVYNSMVHNFFDMRNLYVRNSLIGKLLSHWNFHIWFNFATGSFTIKKNETWYSYVPFYIDHNELVARPTETKTVNSTKFCTLSWSLCPGRNFRNFKPMLRMCLRVRFFQNFSMLKNCKAQLNQSTWKSEAYFLSFSKRKNYPLKQQNGTKGNRGYNVTW